MMGTLTGMALIIADGSTEIGVSAVERAAAAGAQVVVLEQAGRPVRDKIRAILGEAAEELIWPLDLSGPAGVNCLS